MHFALHLMPIDDRASALLVSLWHDPFNFCTLPIASRRVDSFSILACAFNEAKADATRSVKCTYKKMTCYHGAMLADNQMYAIAP